MEKDFEFTENVRSLLTKDLIEFYVQQVEKRKESLVKRVSNAINRGYLLLSITLPLLSAAYAWMISVPSVSAYYSTLYLTVLMSYIVFFYLKPHKTYASGCSLEVLDINNAVEEYKTLMEKDKMYIQILCDHIQIIQYDVRNAEICLDNLLSKQQKCVFFYILGFITLSLVYIIENISLHIYELLSCSCRG